jgi:hypothetical protein
MNPGERLHKILKNSYTVDRDDLINKTAFEIFNSHNKRSFINHKELKPLINDDKTNTISQICLDIINEYPDSVSYIENNENSTTVLMEACKCKLVSVINKILDKNLLCIPDHIYTRDGYNDSALTCLLTQYCGITLPEIEIESMVFSLIKIGGLNPRILYKVINICCYSIGYKKIGLYVINYITLNINKYKDIMNNNYNTLKNACEYNCEDIAIYFLNNEIEKNSLDYSLLRIPYEYARKNNMTKFLEILEQHHTFKPIKYDDIKNNIINDPKLLIGLFLNKVIEKDICKKFRKCRIFYPGFGESCDYITNRINIKVCHSNDEFFITSYGYG